jgi:hypothetical protein
MNRDSFFVNHRHVEPWKKHEKNVFRTLLLEGFGKYRFPEICSIPDDFTGIKDERVLK